MSIIVIIFILGYLAIAFEKSLRINKTATALVTGVLCWTTYIILTNEKEGVVEQLIHHLGEISQILFFLLGAMTIVEIIDTHNGFELITNRINTTSKRKLLWIIGIISFFLSAVLDNLTTAIVMISLIRKLVNDKNDRLILAALIIIAANAGGSWSPIGDVTTTMLWIGGQVTAVNIIIKLIIPSLVCLLVALILLGFIFKGTIQKPADRVQEKFSHTTVFRRNIVFGTGITVLLMVPVFKMTTHLPPFMGMLAGLGVMWIITEIILRNEDENNKKNFSVADSLRRIDTPTILFFLGILLAVAALQSTGQLTLLAGWMDNNIKNQNLIVMSIGVLSSVIDNVPLVAASMGMYSLEQFPADHYFWEFLAYCAGTGGSILIIGSAAGVAAMGIEKIDFMWYLKRISWIALLAYISGAVIYMLMNATI
jgi:NhaD family Na+/H+ antiporter